MKNSIEVKSLSQLPAAAEKLIAANPDKRVFAFDGAMGAGKTSFITRICAFLDVEDAVSSPTFALINEYYSPSQGAVYHFDLYRLKDQEELLGLGAEEYFYSGNYCFVEWPELAKQLLPENTVYVSVHESGEEGARLIEF